MAVTFIPKWTTTTPSEALLQASSPIPPYNLTRQAPTMVTMGLMVYLQAAVLVAVCQVPAPSGTDPTPLALSEVLPSTTSLLSTNRAARPDMPPWAAAGLFLRQLVRAMHLSSAERKTTKKLDLLFFLDLQSESLEYQHLRCETHKKGHANRRALSCAFVPSVQLKQIL